jgi:hypothetical protein
MEYLTKRMYNLAALDLENNNDVAPRAMLAKAVTFLKP